MLEKGFDRTRERLAFPFPEQDFLAVGEEDIGDVHFLGVGFGLRRRVAWADRKSLGLDDGQGATVAVAKHIVGASVLEDVLEADAVLIVGVPALVFKLGVDKDAGKCLIAFRHTLNKSLCFLAEAAPAAEDVFSDDSVQLILGDQCLTGIKHSSSN